MSGFWITLTIGFWLGFGYRIWGERRAARHDPPAWVTRLGYSLVEQFQTVDDGQKFTGDEVVVTSRKQYSGGEKSYVVEVERGRVEA